METNATALKVDQLNNVYLIDGDILNKYDDFGNLLFSFSRADFGHISSLDISNPLKPCVFYKDVGQFLVLDNTLSEQADPIDLFSLFNGNITLACQSTNSHYWFYNESNFELLRVNSRFEVEFSTGNIASMLGKNIEGQSMIEKDNFLYLNDPKLGILKFDIYASYHTTLLVKEAQNPRYHGGEVFYNRADSLFIYNTLSFDTQFITLPVKVQSEVHIQGEKMYFISDKSLQVYSY